MYIQNPKYFFQNKFSPRKNNNFLSDFFYHKVLINIFPTPPTRASGSVSKPLYKVYTEKITITPDSQICIFNYTFGKVYIGSGAFLGVYIGLRCIQGSEEVYIG